MPDRCYRLHEAIQVENGNHIYFDTNLPVKSVFLLGEGERRYREIAESDARNQRQYFRLNEHFRKMASSEISNFKTQLEILTDVPITGMYIRTLEVANFFRLKLTPLNELYTRMPIASIDVLSTGDGFYTKDSLWIDIRSPMSIVFDERLPRQIR